MRPQTKGTPPRTVPGGALCSPNDVMGLQSTTEMVIELVRKDAAMLKDDPYDTSIERPVRGGGHKVARGVVRT